MFKSRASASSNPSKKEGSRRAPKGKLDRPVMMGAPDKHSKKSSFGAKKPGKSRAGKPVAVFDVGSKTSKVVVGKVKDNRIYIDVLDGIINPKSCIDDGKIVDHHGVYSTIKELLNNNGVKLRDAVFTVDSREILRREMDIADVAKAEDRMGLVSYEMGQYLPIDTTSYVMQLKVISAYEEERARKLKVSVGAVPKNLIEPYVKLTDDAGLERVAMDINSNSIEKLINLEIASNPRSSLKDKNIVFIDMGHSYFNISIFGNGRYLFNKIVEVGGVNLDNAIAERMGVSEDEAEVIKIKNGTTYSVMDIIYHLHETPDSNNLNDLVLKDSLSTLDEWANEISQVLKYYTTRNRKNTIDEICLYGGCSFIKGIDEYFEKKLSLPTRCFYKFESVRLSNHELNDNILNYLNAIGALIR
ncbi:MAG: pilus assembly protein PilM [Clostridiales bacterium]|jgi:type IV pilus assembly protein PilM|nr:pilus assembly protein PilM [Clostridiales bacterium]